MNSSNALIIGLLIVGIGIGGYFVVSKNSDLTENTSQTELSNIPEKNGDDMMEKDETSAEIPNNIVEYSPENLATAQEAGRAVLFFHATWCPTCKALNAEIMERANELPEDVTILKTDFDKELELREQYGITIQHTLVQLDANGNEIAKWSGGNVDTILENLQ